LIDVSKCLINIPEILLVHLRVNLSAEARAHSRMRRCLGERARGSAVLGSEGLSNINEVAALLSCWRSGLICVLLVEVDVVFIDIEEGLLRGGGVLTHLLASEAPPCLLGHHLVDLAGHRLLGFSRRHYLLSLNFELASRVVLVHHLEPHLSTGLRPPPSATN